MTPQMSWTELGKPNQSVEHLSPPLHLHSAGVSDRLTFEGHGTRERRGEAGDHGPNETGRDGHYRGLPDAGHPASQIRVGTLGTTAGA